MGNSPSGDPLRIFVTTCGPMWRVEKALEYSIKKYCSEPCEVHFLRTGDPGFETNDELGIPHTDVNAIKKAKCWNTGRSHSRPYSGEGWQTPFSSFRFAIPELCNFKGRAIHMDADFLVLKDLRPIFEMKMIAPVMSPHKRTDFMLIDCGKFQELVMMGIWPSLDEMKASGNVVEQYRNLLKQNLFMGEGDTKWESWDGKNLDKDTFAIHFTEMNTQPWEPYPEYFKYPPHPSPIAVNLFWQHYAEALEAEARGEISLQAKDLTEPNKTPLSLAKNQ
jgi:hypothetical protein